MDVARWERIKELFNGALQCEAVERADFLIQACPDDADLRREVESLLSGDLKAGRYSRTSRRRYVQYAKIAFMMP